MNIAQVAKQFNLTAATLRYYERIGLIPPVKRKENGIRDYGEDDIKWVEFAKCMRSAGLSIESLIEYRSLVDEGNQTIKARYNILVEERERLIEKLLEIEETVKKLDKKIKHYDGLLPKKEVEIKNLKSISGK